MGVNNLLKSHVGGYTMYVALALVGIGIMVVAAPIMYVLLFCPMQICLRKKMIYTKCEEIWPAVVLVFLGLGVIACCLVGIFSNYRMYSGYE